MAQLDGEPADPQDLTALAMVNYGHFTSLRIEGGRVRGLELHLERLARDCRALFDAELDPQRVRAMVRTAVADRPSVVARVTVFDPRLQFARPGVRAEPRILVTVRPAPTEPASAMSVAVADYARECPRIKHTGLFETVRLRRTAQRARFDDVLFARDGQISEGATWNIGFFDGEGVLWPAEPTLPGVTAALLDKVHGRHSTLPVRLSDLPDLVAAFATNAAVGVRAIGRIGEVRFPDAHPVIRELQGEYAAVPAQVL